MRRRLHFLCAEALAPRVIAWRVPVLLLFAAATAVFSVAAGLLRDPGNETVFAYWPPDHHLGRRFDLEYKVLRPGDAGIEAALVFGIATIDRTGTDPTDDADLGAPVFRRGFDLASTAAQAYLRGLCETLESEADALSLAPAPGGGRARVDCFMKAFAEWRAARGKAFPVPPAQFADRYEDFLRREAARDVRSQVTIASDEGKRTMRFAHVKLTTDVPFYARCSV